MSDKNEPCCEQCGFPLSSDTHQRGIGLHGHERTSKAEADAQRADVMARALAFAERMAAEDSSMPEAGAAGATSRRAPRRRQQTKE